MNKVTRLVFDDKTNTDRSNEPQIVIMYTGSKE